MGARSCKVVVSVFRPVLPAVSLLLLTAAGAQATGSSSPPVPPAERVFVTSVNNKILEVNFGSGTTRTVVNSSGSNFQGLAVRNDLHLAVADHNGGGRVKLFNTSGQGKTITSAIAFPGGITVDGDQRLYVTNAHPGQPDEVWRIDRNYASCLDGADPIACVAAGYKAAVKIDTTATQKLADVKVADGKLWVLASDPALLLVYDDPTCSSCVERVAIATSFFGGYTPNGLTFTGTEILVATSQGKVLRFDLARAKNDIATDDTRLTPDFASTGFSLQRIAVGFQGGQLRVFVTAQPKYVKQYAIADDGTGTFLKAVGGLNSPVGVSLASAGGAVTSAGAGTEVVMNSIEATFENVTTAGVSDAWCVSFTDPREDSLTLLNPSGPLGSDLALNDSRLPQVIRDLDFPNVIPSYVRAFRQGSSTADTASTATGLPTFRFCHATTTARFNTLVRVMGESEAQWLGYDPACNNANRWLRPRFFYSEEPPEPTLAEGRVFINNTSMCNRDTSDSWKMKSIYVTGARETRPPDNVHVCVADAAPAGLEAACDPEAGVVDCQLNRLRAVVVALGAPTSCVDGDFQSSLLGLLDQAIYKFDHGYYRTAKEKLISFEKKVRCEEAIEGGAFATCLGSETSGELRSRAMGSIFGLCDGLSAGKCPCNQTLATGYQCSPVPACSSY